MTLERIEELAKKLSHLTGEDCTKYVTLWLLAHAKRRDELLSLLELKCRQLSPPGTLWLEPIPQEAMSGELVLGDVLAQGRPVYPFRVSLRSLLRHVTIFGQTGGGKTNFGFLLLQQLLKLNVPFLVCDWKRNYRDLLALDQAPIDVITVGRSVRPFQLNPLIPPPGTSPETWLKKITEVIARAYYVGEGVMSILHRGLDAIYAEYGVYAGTATRWPTMDDLRCWIEDYVQRASGKELKAPWIASTQRTLQSLCFGDMGRVLNVDTSTPVQDLLARPTILELDALAEQEKKLIIETLLLWIHHYRMQESGRETLKHVILIEEAHHVLRKEEPHAQDGIIDIVLREIRELGEAIVMCDQNPGQFSQNAIGNSATSFVFALKNKPDVLSASGFLRLDDDQRELLHELSVGTCVVKLSDSWRKPFLVQLPHVRVPKGQITDDHLRGESLRASSDSLLQALDSLKVATTTLKDEGLSAHSTGSPGVQPEFPDVPPADKKEPKDVIGKLSNAELCFIKDVLERPYAGLSSRYERLGVSVRNGQRIKQAIEDLGLVTIVAVNKGDTQIKLVEFTALGRSVIKHVFPQWKLSQALEGAEHRYWKNRVATALEDAGLHVEQEKKLNGDRTDIHVHNGGSANIEIETGKSDIRKNLRKNLESGVEQVVIVPTNKKARKKVQQAVKDASLTKHK